MLRIWQVERGKKKCVNMLECDVCVCEVCGSLASISAVPDCVLALGISRRPGLVALCPAHSTADQHLIHFLVSVSGQWCPALSSSTLHCCTDHCDHSHQCWSWVQQVTPQTHVSVRCLKMLSRPDIGGCWPIPVVSSVTVLNCPYATLSTLTAPSLVTGRTHVFCHISTINYARTKQQSAPHHHHFLFKSIVYIYIFEEIFISGPAIFNAWKLAIVARHCYNIFLPDQNVKLWDSFKIFSLLHKSSCP